MELLYESTFDRLLKQRILPSSDIPPHDFLFTWHDIPCFARGELVAVTGKAKSGKTYLNSILMAAAGAPQNERLTSERMNELRNERVGELGCEGHFLGLRRMQGSPLKVLWIDTEQSEDSTHEILRDRIGRLIGQDPAEDHYFVFNLRQINWQDREIMIESAIYVYEPDLVIFDGIRDVVGDINNYEEAQKIIGRLLSIASDRRTCIVCVLHQNKAIEDKTLRGALGTELQNKSFETYECAKDTETHVFTVRQIATRKYDLPNKQQFILTPDGLPIPYVGDDGNELTNERMKVEGFNTAYLGVDGKFDKMKLFGYILQKGKRMHLAQLREVVMKVGNIKSFNFAGKLIEEACVNGVIGQTECEGQKVYGLCEQTIF